MNIHDPIFDCILTPQEYATHEYDVPYILKRELGHQAVFLYGCNHSFDPNNEQFTNIEQLLEEYRKKYHDENIVILVENGIPPVEESKQLMIQKFGESGLMTFLAKKYHFACECLEQPTVKLNQYVLEKGFAKDDLMLWIFLNQLWFVSYKQPIDSEEIKRIREVVEINKNGRLEHWLLKFHERLYQLTRKEYFPKTVEELMYARIDREKVKKLQDPFEKGTTLNEIASTVNHARDRYFAASILLSLKHGKTVFAALGWNHVVALEHSLLSF